MTKAEQTRLRIIEQTAPIFNTKGVEATAVADIMVATKMAKGSLYVHFRNKDELAYAAVDYNLQRFFEVAAEVMETAISAKDKFFALLELLSNPVKHPIAGGCPMLNFGVEADDTNTVILRKVETAMKKLQTELVAILEKGVSNQEFVSGWNIEEFVLKTFAMLEGGVLISRVYGRADPMKTLISILKCELEEKARVG